MDNSWSVAPKKNAASRWVSNNYSIILHLNWRKNTIAIRWIDMFKETEEIRAGARHRIANWSSSTIPISRSSTANAVVKIIAWSAGASITRIWAARSIGDIRAWILRINLLSILQGAQSSNSALIANSGWNVIKDVQPWYVGVSNNSVTSVEEWAALMAHVLAHLIQVLDDFYFNKYLF